MILLSLARRLSKAHPHRLLLILINCPISHSLPPPHSHPLHHLSHAFRLSYLLPSKCPLYNRRFSTPQPLPTRNLDDPIELNGGFQYLDPEDGNLLRFIKLLDRVGHLPMEAEAMAALDESSIEVNQHLVYSAMWELREKWRPSFLAFKWGEKWGCVVEKTYNLMVWVLGNQRKFNIAWSLIHELHGSSMDTRKAMLIMIDRYAYSNDPSKAIRTFQIMEKLRLAPDQEAFYALLSALCKHGNIEEAEEFMLVNRKLFPLETKSFNIILNGWCNISAVDVFEAKRIWREMSRRCITPDSTSYSHMISCFSKVGNLFDSLRLYDEMKKRGWVPGLTAYNSLIYVLTRENCFTEALKIVETIKEVGLEPDSSTYNSMIRPLCEAQKRDDARAILTMMTRENVRPTMETYRAFIGAEGFEETLKMLNQMNKAGLGPCEETFLIVLSKLFKLEQPENALKIWVEMKEYKVSPNSELYSVLVQGLAACGRLNKAGEFYDEMISSGFVVDPKLKKLLNESEQGVGHASNRQIPQVKRNKAANYRRGSTMRWKIQRRQSRKSAIE